MCPAEEIIYDTAHGQLGEKDTLKHHRELKTEDAAMNKINTVCLISTIFNVIILVINVGNRQKIGK